MTSMKITQCSRPPLHPPCLPTSKILPPLDLGRPISNKPFQMITNQLKVNIIQGWLLYVIRSFLQVGFRFQYQLIDLFWLSIDFFCIYLKQISSKLNWTRTMHFFVALYSCVWSCPKISRNAFFKEVFFSTHFAFNLFYFHNFKR